MRLSRPDYTNGVLQAVSSSMESFAPRLWAYEIRNSVLMGLRRGPVSARLTPKGFWIPWTISTSASRTRSKLAEPNGLTVESPAHALLV